MVIPLTVNIPVLQSRVPHPHHVVHAEACTHDILDSLMFLLHGPEDASPAVGEYSKSILHYPASTGELVVIRSSTVMFLCPNGFIIQVRRANASSPMKKYGISRSSLGSGSPGGNPMAPVSSDALRAEALKIPLSEEEPLLPTSAQRNLYSESTKPRSTIEKKLVVVEQGTGLLRGLDRDVFSVQRPTRMMEVPSIPKSLGNLQNKI